MEDTDQWRLRQCCIIRSSEITDEVTVRVETSFYRREPRITLSQSVRRSLSAVKFWSSNTAAVGPPRLGLYTERRHISSSVQRTKFRARWMLLIIAGRRADINSAS